MKSKDEDWKRFCNDEKTKTATTYPEVEFPSVELEPSMASFIHNIDRSVFIVKNKPFDGIIVKNLCGMKISKNKGIVIYTSIFV